MLFDELDIERQLAPDWVESKLYCSGMTDTRGALGANWAAKSAEENAEDAADANSTVRQDTVLRDGTIIKAASTSPKAQAAERNARWQDQCFLIEAWRPIVEKFQARGCKKASSGYQFVVPVLAESSDIVSVMANRPNANIFFTLSPAQLSMLVPSIRLYIVNYKEVKQKGKPSKIVQSGKPQELYLDDHTERDIVESIMSTHGGRAAAVGLQSFDYEFDGKDPATTNTLIKASLKLMFTSFNTLLRKQSNGAKFLDLLLRTQKMVTPARRDKLVGDKDDKYNWCRQPKLESKESDSELVFNPQYRRIKASVGWAIPPGDLFFEEFSAKDRGNFSDFKPKVVELLRQMQLHLFLEMTSYDINFRNDGKVELTINYRAAVEGEMSEPESNIFFRLVQSVKSQTRNKEEEIKKTIKERKVAEEKLGAIKAGAEATDDQKDKQKDIAERSQRDRSTIEKNAAMKIERDKLMYYSMFLDKLQESGKVIALHIKKESLNMWRGAADMSPPGAKKDVSVEDTTSGPKGGLSAYEMVGDILNKGDKYGRYEVIVPGTQTETTSEQETDLAKTSVGKTVKALDDNKAAIISANVSEAEDEGFISSDYKKPEGPSKKEIQKDVQDATLSTSNRFNALANENRSIYFTFLGDILDTAMHFISAVNRSGGSLESSIRLITSQVSFTDPSAADAGCGGSNATLNISDIPVSLDEFNLWFYNNVIKPGRTQYFLIDFIKDVMTNLVFQAFGFNCTAGAPAITPVLNYTLFSAPRKESGREPITLGKRYNNLGGLRKAVNHMRAQKDPSEAVNYLIIHGAARSFVNKTSSDLAKDERDGIYHFGLGLDRGILKEIKFSGNTLKYATETRVIEDGQSGLEQLFEKFDADVELYGCPIFRNGQYVYLDPRTMGVDSSVARAIGLGGYYNIYNVSGELDRAHYTMTLKCKYQGSGLCGDEAASCESFKGLCAEDVGKFMGALGETPLDSETAETRVSAVKKADPTGEILKDKLK